MDQQEREFITNKGEVIRSPYSDSEVVDIIKAVPEPFVKALVSSYWRQGWSDGQRAAAHKVAVDIKATERPPPGVAVRMKDIVEVFERSHGERPKVVLRMPKGTIVLRYRRSGDYVGKILVLDGRNKPYGLIHDTGIFQWERRSPPDWVITTLNTMQERGPYNFLHGYGQWRKWCPFCDTPLSLDPAALKNGFHVLCKAEF